MELKPYDKAYLLAFKGLFLLAIGIVAMLQIVGSIKFLNIIFVVLISAIGAVSIGSGIFLKNNSTKIWSVVSGCINICFALYLLLKIESPTLENLEIMFLWVYFFVFTEIVETILLLLQKNAFAALYLINVLLSALFGFFLYVVIGNFTPQGVFYLGLIASAFGLTNLLSAYLLKRV